MYAAAMLTLTRYDAICQLEQARFGSSNILLAYAFTTCVAYVFFYCFVPETSGLALEAAQ